ncbi:Ku protein [Citricoccus sp. SGAir0253]|nr:Ku protein [Citricoccus sp. SGAir0253]QCU77239.1 Ku protein [Citricoccus sp. SGAir0253]
MRAIWSGSITFGLVNVPVKAYSATTDHDVSLHQVHDADGGRIRYQRRCEVCGKTVEYEHIDKAYDDGEQTVVLTEDDLEALPEAANDEIEVVQFVPAGQIDPVWLERSYFLEPQGKSPKSYLLLREALEATDRTAVVTFALRQKTRLGVLRVQDDVLVLQGMHWADEIREVDFPATRSRARISPKEKKLARALVDQFAGDFSPEDFEDTYQQELRVLIDAKLEQGEALDTDATFGDVEDSAVEDDAEVIDLMEALKASLEKKRGGRRAGGAGGRGAAKGRGGGRGTATGRRATSARGTAAGGRSSRAKDSDAAGAGASGGSGDSRKATGSGGGRRKGATSGATSGTKSSGTRSPGTASSGGRGGRKAAGASRRESA